MKLRLNKKILADMPTLVRGIVADWKAQYGKAFISVENRPIFFVNEDARVTIINLHMDEKRTAQVAGTFSGMTRFSPCSEIPLAEGMVAIETGFFLGVPFLNLYQGCKAQLEGIAA